MNNQPASGIAYKPYFNDVSTHYPINFRHSSYSVSVYSEGAAQLADITGFSSMCGPYLRAKRLAEAMISSSGVAGLIFLISALMPNII